MPASKAELWSQITLAAKVFDQIYKFGNENATNYVAMKTAVIEALEGDHSATTARVLKDVQSALSSDFKKGKEIMTALFKELASNGYGINTTSKSINEILVEIRDAMVDVPETIASRDITFGSVSAGGSNVSTGNFYRTTLDRHNNKIESGQVGTVKAEIIQDKNSGATPGVERYRISGSGRIKVDEIDPGDTTSKSALFNIVSAGSNQNYLKNPDFSGIEAVITKTEQSGWTLSDHTKFAKNTTIKYRQKAGNEGIINPVGCSLEFLDNAWFAQYFTREGTGRRVDLNRPFFLLVYYYRDAADGELEICLGASTKSVADLTAVADTSWLVTTIGPDSDDGWFDNFNEDWVGSNQALGNRVRVEWKNGTTGSLYIGGVLLVQANLFNGTYHIIDAGSNTGATSGEARKGDNWTYTDSYTTGGVAQGRTQDIIRKYYDTYLHHTTGAESYADA